MPNLKAELAELVDALDSDSSVLKNIRVQVPSSAFSNQSITLLDTIRQVFKA